MSFPPVPEVAEQTRLPTPLDSGPRTLTDRFGNLRAGGWRIYRDKITAVDTFATLPAWRAHTESKRVEFLVIRPPSVTSFAVQLGRVIGVTAGDAGARGYTLQQLHLEQVSGLVTGRSWSGIIDRQRDLVWCGIHTLNGTADTIADVAGELSISKPNDAAGVQAGFIILARDAD